MDSGYLKGTVQKEDYLPKTNLPSLNRQDAGHRDAFGDGGQQNGVPAGQEFEPPAGAFDVTNMMPQMPAPPQRTFPLNADQNEFKGAVQQPDFDDQAMPPMGAQQPQMGQMPPQMGQMPPRFATLPPNVMPPQQLRQQDPDSSPEMRLAWDVWHHRVAEAIYVRFNAMAQLAFRYSRPLAVYVSYTVTRDGRVTNIQLLQKSPNVAFNAMVFMVVNSMSGQKDTLAFPQGSRRMTVDKGGMFTQNYGVQGFKYITGDYETLKLQHP
jgi:hypothetical protein